MIVNLEAGDPGPAFWVSLRYFTLTRLVIAAVLLGTVLATGGQSYFGIAEPDLFLRTTITYAVLGAMFAYFANNRQQRFYTQLIAQLLLDLLALTVLMNATGGARGGFAILFLLPVAGAAILSPTMLALGFAAISSLAILGETLVRELSVDFASGTMISAGLYGTASFAIALVMNRLAARVIVQERIAEQRGEDLQGQIEINRLVVADMQDGVLILGADGEPRALNPSAVRMLQIDNPDLFVARGWGGHGAGKPIREHFLARRDHLERPAQSVEFETTDAAGAILRLRARFLEPQHDRFVEGDHVVLLEDLNRLEERAQQLKLASMGRLTASIAHEIRNPLAAISHASALLSEGEVSDSERRLLEIVQDNTRRLDRIVENILQMSRRGPAQNDDVELAPFLSTLIDEFCRYNNCSQNMIDCSVFGDPVVSFNVEHLRQIVLNLLLNAKRYASDRPGSVRITAVPVTTAVQSPGVPDSLPRVPHERIELIVQDDGPGVDAAARQHLFEPFFTTHSQGTGLGLFLARELCLANGATLGYVTNVEDSKRGGFVVNAAGILRPGKRMMQEPLRADADVH